MARPTRKFTVSLSDNQHPVVTFEGDYINKRELDLCIRALKKEQRKVINEYRRKKIIAEHELQKKGQVTDDTRGTKGTEGSGSETKTGTGVTGTTGTAKAADAGSVGRVANPNNNGVSGTAGKVPGAPGTEPKSKGASKDA